MSSTPTLFNAGTLPRPAIQLLPDHGSGRYIEIYGAIRDNALLSKFAGGLSNDWTPVRSLGSRIKGTNGKSRALSLLESRQRHNRCGEPRRQAQGRCLCLPETWHLDIEEFLKLRKNTGDERRHTR